PQDDWQAEDIDLDIVYAAEALLIVNKAAGLVVHPAAGNQHGTLLNALLFRYPELENLPRAGIVHRLDKDTSGLMMVALTLASHRSLVAQLQERSIIREYQAVVVGLITAGGVVDAPIGRHPAVRTRQAIVKGAGGRDAVTHYRVLEKFRSHTHIQLKLETGRTHQIRVHMAHMGYPLVGDQTYGGRLKLPRGASAELIDCLRSYKRQALHAFHLGLQHPQSGEYLEWYAPLPQDMQHLLGILEQDNA
ncbi:MAG: 23S rRNA pseudouridine(1911/1915/1917) synthase RluD, partial [Pseudohongiellaceae bacterium]